MRFTNHKRKSIDRRDIDPQKDMREEVRAADLGDAPYKSTEAHREKCRRNNKKNGVAYEAQRKKKKEDGQEAERMNTLNNRSWLSRPL